jgi:hypothetical protein
MKKIVAGVVTTLVVIISLFVFGRTPDAGAANGDAITVGGDSVGTSPTTLVDNGCTQTCSANQVGGLTVFHHVTENDIFPVGIQGYGDYIGMQGITYATASGYGVYGTADSIQGYGVYGEQLGTGFGVAGRATTQAGTAVGVLGDAPNSPDGIGVDAASATGTALRVRGTAQFSRSGRVSVKGTSTTPKNSVRVTLPITSTSMMIATLQSTSVSGVWVVAAVPNVAGDYFTIYLNKSVQTTVGPIAWMVFERP